MRLRPSSPLELPSPSGNRSVAEFRSSRVDSSADAHRKTIRAVNSTASWVSRSMTRTPVARSR